MPPAAELLAELETTRGRLAAVESEKERAESERLRAEHDRDEYRKLYELVTLELSRLRRGLFGKKSERVDPDQVQLAFDALKEELAELESSTGDDDEAKTPEITVAAHSRRAKGHGRRNLGMDLSHLPVVEVLQEPAGNLKENPAYVRIGEETSERVEWRAASYVLVRTVRPKYAKKGEPEAGIITTEPMDTPIPRCMAGPGLLAHVMVSKYADHLPWHRLEKIFSRQGVPFSRSTLCTWTEQVARLLEPLVLAMRREAFGAAWLATDATGVLVQAKERCRRGHFWVQVSENGHVLFRFTEQHTSATAKELLQGYEGYLVADAATVFDILYRTENIIEVGCWFHCRRRFFDALNEDKDRALVALGFIQKLFRIESELTKKSRQHREKVRSARSAPTVEKFYAWLDKVSLEVVPRSTLGQAVRYARNQREALRRFLSDGRLPIHNNMSERQLRRQAVGRKNWLFVASKDGAEWNATLVSLIASCELHGIEPWAYLRDVLCLIEKWSAKKVIELAPKYWRETAARPEVEVELRANPFRMAGLEFTPPR